MGPFISPRVLWALTQGQVIFVFAVLLFHVLLIVSFVITRAKRRKAEMELERLTNSTETENKRLTDLLKNVPGIVWETKIDPISHQHVTTFVSNQAEKMLGYTPQEWSASPDFCLQLVHEADRERVKRELEEITRNNFTCNSSGNSPISSRKTVPPDAISRRPFFCAMAPVNAPRS